MAEIEPETAVSIQFARLFSYRAASVLEERFWLDGITFVNAHLIALAKSIAEETSANLATSFMRSSNRRRCVTPVSIVISVQIRAALPLQVELTYATLS